jgi:hypothetical protein
MTYYSSTTFSLGFLGSSGRGDYNDEFRAKWLKRDGLIFGFPKAEAVQNLIERINKVNSRSCVQHFRVVWNQAIKEMKVRAEEYARSLQDLKSDSAESVAATPVYKQNMNGLPASELCKMAIRFNGLPDNHSLFPLPSMDRIYIQDGHPFYQLKGLNFKKPYMVLYTAANGHPVPLGTQFGCIYQSSDQVKQDEDSPREPQMQIDLAVAGMPIMWIKIIYPVSSYRKFQNLGAIEKFLNGNGFEQTYLIPDTRRFYPSFMLDGDVRIGFAGRR